MGSANKPTKPMRSARIRGGLVHVSTHSARIDQLRHRQFVLLMQQPRSFPSHARDVRGVFRVLPLVFRHALVTPFHIPGAGRRLLSRYRRYWSKWLAGWLVRWLLWWLRRYRYRSFDRTFIAPFNRMDAITPTPGVAVKSSTRLEMSNRRQPPPQCPSHTHTYMGGWVHG